jgi:hypothetical protein
MVSWYGGVKLEANYPAMGCIFDGRCRLRAFRAFLKGKTEEIEDLRMKGMERYPESKNNFIERSFSSTELLSCWRMVGSVLFLAPPHFQALELSLIRCQRHNLGKHQPQYSDLTSFDAFLKHLSQL